MDRITRAAVTRWFDDYSRTAPDGANRALNLLRQILNRAIVCGHLDTNPARGIKLNPRPKLTRFLSREEVLRIHRVLDRNSAAKASRARQADIIRLLLLTGCRKSEIVTMRWRDLDGNTFNLGDAKTGPRKVLPECARPRRPGPAAANGERVGLSLAARSRTAAFVPPPALVPGAQASRDRGRADSRSQTHVCQPRRSAGRSVAGRLPIARPQAAEHDTALCPCR